MLHVNHTMERLVTRLNVVNAQVPFARTEAIRTVGVQVLAWGWLDYRDKSRGGSDVTGYQWKPLSPRTIEARWRKQFGKGWRGRVAGIQKREATKGLAKTKTGKVRPSRLAVAIGIDTGRLVNSLDFKTTGNPDQIFTVSSKALTVGSAVLYAGYFDRPRRIFSPRFLTVDRRKRIKTLFVSAYTRAIKFAREKATP